MITIKGPNIPLIAAMNGEKYIHYSRKVGAITTSNFIEFLIELFEILHSQGEVIKSIGL